MLRNLTVSSVCGCGREEEEKVNGWSSVTPDRAKVLGRSRNPDDDLMVIVSS